MIEHLKLTKWEKKNKTKYTGKQEQEQHQLASRRKGTNNTYH